MTRCLQVITPEGAEHIDVAGLLVEAAAGSRLDQPTRVEEDSLAAHVEGAVHRDRPPVVDRSAGVAGEAPGEARALASGIDGDGGAGVVEQVAARGRDVPVERSALEGYRSAVDHSAAGRSGLTEAHERPTRQDDLGSGPVVDAATVGRRLVPVQVHVVGRHPGASGTGHVHVALVEHRSAGPPGDVAVDVDATGATGGRRHVGDLEDPAGPNRHRAAGAARGVAVEGLVRVGRRGHRVVHRDRTRDEDRPAVTGRVSTEEGDLDQAEVGAGGHLEVAVGHRRRVDAGELVAGHTVADDRDVDVRGDVQVADVVTAVAVAAAADRQGHGRDRRVDGDRGSGAGSGVGLLDRGAQRAHVAGGQALAVAGCEVDQVVGGVDDEGAGGLGRRRGQDHDGRGHHRGGGRGTSDDAHGSGPAPAALPVPTPSAGGHATGGRGRRSVGRFRMIHGVHFGRDRLMLSAPQGP